MRRRAARHHRSRTRPVMTTVPPGKVAPCARSSRWDRRGTAGPLDQQHRTVPGPAATSATIQKGCPSEGVDRRGCLPGPMPSVTGSQGRQGAAVPVCAGKAHGAQDRPDEVRLGHHQGELFAHDVIIRLGGQVEQRNKKLSKAVYGTSHTISLAEAKHIHHKGVARLLIGAGQHGTVTLSEAAAAYFARHRCQVELLSTPEVIPVWNQAQGAVIGLVHVTCRGERRETVERRESNAVPREVGGGRVLAHQ